MARSHMVVSINGGSLIPGWLMGSPIKMDDLGYPHFSGNPPGMGVKHENFWDINGLINDI